MDNYKLLTEYYKKYLNREPDKEGFSHYLSLLERGELNEEKLANEFINCPEKKIVEKYISEASRVLKPNCLFRFQVRGTIASKPNQITTWDGVQFTSDEIHKIAQANNFEIIEEGNDKDEYYWLTFQLKK